VCIQQPTHYFYLRYVVAEGWVSPRDFLLGLAIIQAYPGPNFNCTFLSSPPPFIYPPVHPAPPLIPSPNLRLPPLVAVYLGSLAALSSSSLPSAAGATIAFLAIFTPGLILHTGFMGLWRTLRRYRWFTSCLRGINATAVGLVYTAVYRLWEIGYLSKDNQDGSSLGGEPWWVVVTATSFVGGMWFGVSPPVAILLGGAMGMIWYGVVSA
jgi:chromate transport protein ChrA